MLVAILCGISASHAAGPSELSATSLSGQALTREKFYWTPSVQKIQPDLVFLEFLEELKYHNRANIFEKSASEPDIRMIVEAFIQEAFTKEELKGLSLEKDVRFGIHLMRQIKISAQCHGRDFFAVPVDRGFTYQRRRTHGGTELRFIIFDDCRS